MHWTHILGFLLLAWVLYDLMTGKVWLHRAFERGNEPVQYWLTVLLWSAVAISCFFWV
ncbi:MAG: hypothetical protein JJ866_18085 [Roseibium sp.]|uniref:hypothetical protein n=1 Tax=Roseibium sp. TaxID=1936156 RepID=UPI001B1FADD8|nr:hypothetical protein [Roseibium sp.]MBO6509384.1 hypothetical protein [Roseibium sp.]MBO6893854.1 hypothetical protein [Roseibium sp.]MBO6932633.1 hypothetical protein [Roseibium sp.]